MSFKMTLISLPIRVVHNINDKLSYTQITSLNWHERQ